MMEPTELLRRQEECLSQMQGLLAEEFALLKEHQALALPALAGRKQQLLDTIEALDRQLAEQAGGLDAFPERVGHLQRRLEACQAQNDLNGRLLELCIGANRRLASFLCQWRDKHSLTYDARGNPRSGTRSAGIKA